MIELPGHLGRLSGLGLLWTSLSGVYAVRGLYQAIAGSSTARDYAGETGILRFNKQWALLYFLKYKMFLIIIAPDFSLSIYIHLE